MKVGIMQPYFFPYIGYFQLIQATDKWVVFDTPQYISKGWINRNRVLHSNPSKESLYFTVPIKKHKREAKINSILINDNGQWKKRIFGQLTSYKRKSPYYSEVLKLVHKVFEYRTNNLSDFVVNSLDEICKYLEIDFDYFVFSEMGLSINQVEHSGQWALKIADAMGAEEYINPPGGYILFDEEEFIQKNIKLKFLKPRLTPYKQRRDGFVSSLSILDIIMWNSKEEVRGMLEDYDLFDMGEMKRMVKN